MYAWLHDSISAYRETLHMYKDGYMKVEGDISK